MTGTTTQTSVLNAICEKVICSDGGSAVGSPSHRFVNDPQWANTGTVYARPIDSLDAVGARLRYDFQDGRVSFAQVGSGQTVAVWSTTGGTAPCVSPTLDALVDTVVAALLGGES
jgi:hypothetical protein